jgi:hypothetical protein
VELVLLQNRIHNAVIQQKETEQKELTPKIMKLA